MNCPKASDKVLLGKEFRALFICEEGKLIAAGDAAALEGRVMGEYTYKYDHGATAKELLEGDVHSKNAKAFFPPELEGFDVNAPEFDKEDKTFKPFRDRSKNGFYCVPMDTRALTKSGWKFYDQIIIGDFVLGYDPETKTKKWTRVVNKVHFESAPVIEFWHKWLKLRATAEHRWFVKQRKEVRGGGFSFSIRDSVDEVRTTSQLTTESSIIINAPMCKDIDNTPNSSPLMQGKYGVDWVGRVLSMSHNQRVSFLEGFMIADGHYENTWCWSQNDGDLFDAALTASYLVSDGAIQVSSKKNCNGNIIKSATLSKKPHRGLQTSSMKVVGNEPVWCLTTELGSWVMRQGDVITITGNCLCYGGGAPKLAKTLGLPEYRGQEAYDAFWEVNSALKSLKDNVENFWETSGGKKWLPAIDGRRLITRKKSALLNTLFQSCGAIIMEYALNFMDAWLGGVKWENGKPFYLYKGYVVERIGFFHDEGEYECDEDIAPEVAKMIEKAIEKAAQFLKLKIPFAGEGKVGRNWKDVH